MSRKGLNNQHIFFLLIGDFALFTDPVNRLSGEKISYPVPTYSALLGVIRRIYQNPLIYWVIDSCTVLNRIEYESISILDPYKNGKGDRYNYQCLRNCAYLVEAHYEFNKRVALPEREFGYRRTNKKLWKAFEECRDGGYFLGCSDFAAHIEPVSKKYKSYYEGFGEIDFGIMFHSYRMPSVEDPYRYAYLRNVKMVDGVIEYGRPCECPYKRKLFKEKVYIPSAEEHNRIMEEFYSE